jgi:parallel beta-helix repeat protein
MKPKSLITSVLILIGILFTSFDSTVFCAAIFDFNDGTAQGWTLDQMYITSTETKFTPVIGYSLKNFTTELSVYTSSLLIGSSEQNDIFLESPDLSSNTDWQNISGFSVDVKRLLYTPCFGDFANIFFVQLQVRVIDLSDGNKEKLYAEYDGTSFVFHDIKTFSQLYHLTWNTTWLNDPKYKVKNVRLRITGPGDVMAECWYRGSWSVDNVTAVGGSGTTSTIQLTNPNGGQSWAAETPRYITWTGQDIDNKDVKIEYSIDNGSSYNFIASQTNHGTSGSYVWDVPNSPSTQCRVRVSLTSPAISDVSDNVFTITADKKIILDVPNGNDNWKAGTVHYIVWHNYLFSGPVKIEYSINGGSSYSTIESSYSQSTSYAWTVPNTPSANCIVKVSDASDPALFDLSDVAFTISAATASNTSAGNNIQVNLGSGMQITFGQVNNPGNTEAQIQPTGPVPPEYMTIIPQNLPNYYEITTSATFTGNIQINLGYSDAGMGPDQEMALRLFAYNETSSQWEDITSGLDEENNSIAGQTNHLSVFAIMFAASGPGSHRIIVSNTNDAGPGSLREAIYAANMQAGNDTILFNIPKSDPGYDADAGVWTVTPLSFYDALTEGGIIMDGFSQRKFIGEDTNPFGPEIEITGTNAGQYVDGIFITAPYAEILGLTINHFRMGIAMFGVKGGRISGCYVGTNSSGTEAAPNVYGIWLGDSTQNIVICHIDTFRNVISGNTNVGICLADTCFHNAILNNILGMDRTETAAIPNGNYGGIFLEEGSFENSILDNHISGNHFGMYLYKTHLNTIAQNWIGTDPEWKLSLGNEIDGIMMAQGSRDNLIEGNIIGNSGGWGIQVIGPDAIHNKITHNRISSSVNAGISNESDGNLELAPPVITNVTSGFVKGTGLPNVRIEIFSDPDYEGAIFQGDTTTDASGNFTWNGALVGQYNHITALAIDALGNTSEFSQPFVYTGLPPVINKIEDYLMCEGEEIPEIPITFTFNNPNEVVFTGNSDNKGFIPDNHIIFTGEGSSRTLKIEPQLPVGEAGIMVIATGPGDLKDTVHFMVALHPNPKINSLEITPESTVNDGKILVHATSVNGGLMYAINSGILQQSNEFTGLSQGQYLVKVSDDANCTDSATAIVTRFTSIQELSGSYLEIFPNPATAMITLSNPDILKPGYTVEIVTIYGEVMMKGGLFSDGMYSVGTLPEGSYFMRIKSGSNVYIGKIVILR